MPPRPRRRLPVPVRAQERPYGDGDVGFVQEIITRVHAPRQHGRRPRGALQAPRHAACCSTASRPTARSATPRRSSRRATRPAGVRRGGHHPHPDGPRGPDVLADAASTARPPARRPTTTTPEWQPLREFKVSDAPVPPTVDSTVALAVTPPPSSPDEELWFFIRRVTERMRFAEFHEFVQPRMIAAHGVDWTDTGAYEHPAAPVEAVPPARRRPAAGRRRPARPPFGEISLTTAEAGVQRSYVSDEDLDLAQPFLGFDGRAHGRVPTRDPRSTTTTALRVEATATGTTTGAGSRRGGRAAPGTTTATSGHASSRCPTCRSWNCCGPTGWTSAVWRRR